MRSHIIILLLVFYVHPDSLLAQSTSPNLVPLTEFSPLTFELQAAPEDIITFSEFPIGTSISNQYGNRGILFGGAAPFITMDGANPSSPVLSGSPIFRGSIGGTFVEPEDGETPRIVESFKLDAGFFDELRSTRLEWFDPEGNKLGQRANSQFGIETILIEGGNIAKWKISIFEDEPAGYAIDNVSFTPVQASILFREKSGDNKDGTWGSKDDEIPGFDHVAFHIDNLVYESHPGYSPGIYLSMDGEESAFVSANNGVQAQHTKETFKHDSRVLNSSPVIDFEEIPINMDLAKEMRGAINSQISIGAKFQSIAVGSLEAIEKTLSPSAQKGGDNSFTCVGLIEWAAEQAGRNGGQGFIRNSFESFSYPDLSVFPPVIREAPLLSPQLLIYAMKGTLTIDKIQQWFQGFFDPVDFIITDPLGRRLGFTEALGEINEIPGAFFSGNGNLEQFFIPNPIAGSYAIDLVGVGKQVAGAIASSFQAEGINTFLSSGEKSSISFDIELIPGTPGDVNKDGVINEEDTESLKTILNTFTNDPTDPGDINGDGIISDEDLSLLEQLIALRAIVSAEIVIKEAKTKDEEIEIEGYFEVGDDSDGIDVLNEAITITVNEFSHMIPAGSFTRDDDDEGFEYKDVFNGIEIKVEIRDDGEFEVELEDIDGFDLTNPVSFSLQIGNDIGNTLIPFNAKGRFKQ